MTRNTNLFDGIVIFHQVVTSGSFTAAAQISNHSTSYISKEINKLEARLGVRLLNRTTRSISLTPEGKLYFEQCEQLIEDAESSLLDINQNHKEPRGTLKISCPISFGLDYLQPILSDYLKANPKISLDIDFNDRHVDVVQDGYDLVIRATRELNESSLIYRKIYSCQSYTIASHQYLKTHGKPTSPEQLSQHQCICYSNLKNPNRWQYDKKDGSSIYVDVQQHILCNSSQMELAMVIAGHGICRLPGFCLDTALQSGELEVLFPDYIETEINVYALYPSRKHISAKVRSFIDLLVSALN